MALDLKNRTLYSQARYGRGVCFRLSFKWAALSLVGGEFNMATDTAGLNIDSTKAKHIDYRTVSAARETSGTFDFADDAAFKIYVDDDEQQGMDYINRWGLRFKGSKSSGHTVYNGVSVLERREERLTKTFAALPGAESHSLVYGFYGRRAASGTTGPAGHAVAYSKGRFFDANAGEIACVPPAAAGRDIDDFIDTNYKPKWIQERFVVFILQHKPATGP